MVAGEPFCVLDRESLAVRVSRPRPVLVEMLVARFVDTGGNDGWCAERRACITRVELRDAHPRDFVFGGREPAALVGGRDHLVDHARHLGAQGPDHRGVAAGTFRDVDPCHGPKATTRRLRLDDYHSGEG